jgi:hypothetical protein
MKEDDSVEGMGDSEDDEITQSSIMPKKKTLFGGMPNISIILGLGRKK